MSRWPSGAAALVAAALLGLLALAQPALGASQDQRSAAAERGPQVGARAWIVADARNGTVLASHAAAERLPIASTTKLMTAYVTLRELPLDEIVRVAPYEAELGESLLEVPSGERISVRDLLYGLIMRSGNDAAHTLAIAVSGSTKRFVREMNRYAAALGLADTHYSNPIGLDQRGNYSSARDLATLSRRLLRNPAFAKIAASRIALLRSLRPPRRITTINELLYMAPWATGVKTGHTLDARYVLVGSGERKGVELVSVALGSPTDEGRYVANLELLEYGFSQYARRVPVRDGQRVAWPEIRYSGGRLPLEAARRVSVGLRRGQRLGRKVRAPAEVEGPIRRGAVLGSVTVYVDGMEVAKVPLRASRAIPAASDFDRARAFVDDNTLPIAVGAFVILMAGVLLYRLSRRMERGRGNG
ncbi:MAG: D-alanyl-D-alanine carboxypeptidase family protein [Solirubrobacterales bacterium]